jgi:hypothetical protein
LGNLTLKYAVDGLNRQDAQTVYPDMLEGSGESGQFA